MLAADDIEPAPSNLEFDASLRSRDPSWGLRRVEDFAEAAANHGFELIGRVLGLGVAESSALLERVRARRSKQLGIAPEAIEQKLIARVEARKAKDFARADALRDEIAALGIELMDGPEGTTWRIP